MLFCLPRQVSDLYVIIKLQIATASWIDCVALYKRTVFYIQFVNIKIWIYCSFIGMRIETR